MDTKEPSDLFFNDSWSLYFHDPDNNNWDINSYISIATISTVEEWMQIYKQIKDFWNSGMFFLMREHIQPIWEDENNYNGGCISIKIWKSEAAENFFELTSKMLGETLLNDVDNWESICGISISPKRNYCIIRIWISDNMFSNIDLYNYNIPNYSKVMYKPHIDSI